MSFIATAAASFCINGLDFKSFQVTIGIKALKSNKRHSVPHDILKHQQQRQN